LRRLNVSSIESKELVRMVQRLFRFTSDMNGELIRILIKTGMTAPQAAAAMMSGELGEGEARRLADVLVEEWETKPKK
jgi:hypothetical protein